MKVIITKKQQRRKYKLHYNLRKRGHRVVMKERMVVKCEREVSNIENKWLNELIAFGYGVCDDMFAK